MISKPLFLLILGQLGIFVSMAIAQPTTVTLIREGSRIVDAKATLELFTEGVPSTVHIDNGTAGGGTGLVVFPNMRLAEMEAEVTENRGTRFRVSGDVFAYDKGNFLLVREVTAIGSIAKRDAPLVEPESPDANEGDIKKTSDSVDSIIADLEKATGLLNKSIRTAANNPIERASNRNEGTRITNRRGHLVRNSNGAFIFVFVSDATGLSDPPCTILPTTRSQRLFRYASVSGYTIPLLVSGEVLTYHGHDFLILRSWRRVHRVDHLDG